MNNKDIHFKKGLEIRDIRRGYGNRNNTIYADLYLNDELVICATLDYIVKALESNRKEFIK